MSINFETTPIYADTASRRSDGSVLDQGSGASTANQWLLGLESTGGNTPGFHALLRFATGATLTDAEMTVVRGRLRVTAQAQSTLGANYDWLAWAADFGGAIALADYNKDYSNDSVTSEALRVPIGTLFPAAGSPVTDGTVGEVSVPNRFLSKGGGNVSDFEIRPYFASTLVAGANLNLYGTDAGVGNDRPRLIGWAYTDAELYADNPYRFNAVGAESFFAVGIETTPGRAVKPSVLLDSTSVNIDSQAENLESRSLTSQRARPRKVAPGRTGAGGGLTFELTPEKWPILLPGVMKYIGVEDVSASYGGGNTGLKEHFFLPGAISDLKTFTALTRRGPFRNVYPGCVMSNLEISADLDQVVVATCDLMAREEYTYDPDAAGILDANVLDGSASYDTVENSLMSFVNAQVAFANPGGSYIYDHGLVRSFRINLSNNVQEQRGLSKKRSVSSHYALGFRVEVSFSMYFKNELQLRKYLGVSHKDFPFMPEKSVEFQSVQLAMAGSGGSDGLFLTDGVTYRQELVITLPAMMYTVASKPIPGEEAIMLECSAVATYDADTEAIGSLGTFEKGNVKVMLRNTEAATIFDPTTETIPNLITVLPAGASI